MIAFSIVEVHPTAVFWVGITGPLMRSLASADTMPLTGAQKTSIRSMKQTTTKKMREMKPKRLVKAIHRWILSKNEKAKTAVFEITNDKQAQDFVTAVAEELGLDATSPEFKSTLSSIKADDPYKKARGANGIVPAKTVKLICTTYKIKRDVIIDALNTMAGPTGKNGVKIIQGGKADEYPAELKLMAMGGARVYSKGGGNKYVFDVVDKHA
jgi:hypothetical protein